MKYATIKLSEIANNLCPNGHKFCLSPRCWLEQSCAFCKKKLSHRDEAVRCVCKKYGANHGEDTYCSWDCLERAHPD